MPRTGIIIQRGDELAAARIRYIHATEQPQIKTQRIEDYLMKKALEHFEAQKEQTEGTA